MDHADTNAGFQSTVNESEQEMNSNLDQTVLQLSDEYFSATLFADHLDMTVAQAQVHRTQNDAHVQHHLEFNQENEQNSLEQKTLLSKTFGPSLFSDLPLDQTHTHQTLERFEVQSKLGSGAFGDVFGAHDRDLNRNVALKQFKGEGTQALLACHNELRFVGRLEHPSVPPVYQASRTHEGAPYIVMKQVEGDSLEHIIALLQDGDAKTHAKYTFRYRAQLITQLLRVMIQAHGSRVLHRDIKPENIKIGAQGELYLLDWGIAEDFDVAQTNPILCGTPLYMSPEQAQAKPIGPQSDLYSIGAVAYELMTLSQAAPKAQTLQELVDLLQSHKPKIPDFVFHPTQRYMPSEYTQAIIKALTPDLTKRYTSAHEMLLYFEAALNDEFEVVCPRTFTKKMTVRLNKWLNHSLQNVLILYASLLLLVIALIAVGFLLARFL